MSLTAKSFHIPRSIVITLFACATILWSVTVATSPVSAGGYKLSCPDPILEGESATIRVRKPGYEMKWVYAFTYLLTPEHTNNSSADESDYEAYHGKKINGKANSNSLYIPVNIKQDDEPEKNESFEVGFWDEDGFYGCEVKIIDDDAPEIVEIQITSKPVRNFTYFADEAIDVTVMFSDPVDADANALLSLFIGDADESSWRGAKYYHGSGTQNLTFRYRVQPADLDPDGVSVAIATMDIDRNPTQGFSGGIYVRGTDIPVDYDHDGIPSHDKHKIDGRPIALNTQIISAPPEPWIAYRANQTIEVGFNYNIDVEVEGYPTIGLYLGWDGTNGDEAWREAKYLSGSGTDTLVFGYTVTPGDNDDRGVAISIGLPNIGYGGEGTIKARGTDVERSPYYLGSGNQPEHKVDTTPPRIDSVMIESNPKNGEAYDVGETISLRVEFSERIIIAGEPYINVDVGGVDRRAVLHSVLIDAYTDYAVFQYQVQEGDFDDDGIGLFANSFVLNGGSAYDKAGIGLGLTHAAIAADPEQRVITSTDGADRQSENTAAK